MKRIISFLLITFGFSWLFWVPAALVAQGSLTVSPETEAFLLEANPAAWGPLFGAILTALFFEGWTGLKDLLKRGFKVRFGWRWYLAIFLLFPVLIGGSLGIALLLGEPAPEFPALARPYELPFAFIFILLLGGPLQEEFGWRGFLLDKLQEKYSALTSGIMSGLVWGLWHLPLFFMPRQEFYYNRPVWGLLLSTMLVGILFAWVYNNTGRSIFAMLIFHTTFNFSHYIFPTLGSDTASLTLFALMAIVIGIVLWKRGHRTMAGDKIGAKELIRSYG
jgi:uncharacterized protein